MDFRVNNIWVVAQIRKSALALVVFLSVFMYPVGVARATCTIQSSRLQQISEREIVAFIDGRCTKEFGESGYYTKISPDVFGEVRSVYGNRAIDQNGYGWQASYGYHIVFPESSETYAAGVWIADTDGVVHSSEMTIRNSFFR